MLLAARSVLRATWEILVSAILVPVYRRHQITQVSPCTLGNPCPTCAQHVVCFAGNPCKSCRRGRWHECERASPAEPAFYVKFADAVRLVKNRLAKFIHQNAALQLKYWPTCATPVAKWTNAWSSTMPLACAMRARSLISAGPRDSWPRLQRRSAFVLKGLRWF